VPWDHSGRAAPAVADERGTTAGADGKRRGQVRGVAHMSRLVPSALGLVDREEGRISSLRNREREHNRPSIVGAVDA
jgi:hypothetical protein